MKHSRYQNGGQGGNAVIPSATKQLHREMEREEEVTMLLRGKLFSCTNILHVLVYVSLNPVVDQQIPLAVECRE